MDKRVEFLKRLLATFKVEAQEHRSVIASGLVQLESVKADQRPAIVEMVFRAAHSLKGAARAVNCTELESACHALEDVFSHWKQTEAPSNPSCFDLLNRVTDLLSRLILCSGSQDQETNGDNPKELREHIVLLIGQALSLPATSIESGENAPAPANGTRKLPFLNSRLTKPEVGKSKPSPPSNQPEPQPDPAPATFPAAETGNCPSVLETIRVSTKKLDYLLLQTEELLTTKQASFHLAKRLLDIRARCQQWKKSWSRMHPLMRLARKNGAKVTQVDYAKVIEPLLDFLDHNCQAIDGISTEVYNATQGSQQNLRSSSLLIDGLIEDMKKVLMRPFSTVLDGIPRLARDTARELNKEVEVEIQCGDIEMDRQILEDLKDPIIHLIRNSVDHGIELPEEREKRSKNRRGIIRITLEVKGGQEVELTVSDDGAGLVPDKIRQMAVEKKLLDKVHAEALDDQASIMLIFLSGFSTCPIITDLSGRGLGMAIVREKVERLGGKIQLSNRPGQGLSIIIRLPTTRATFRGVMVRVSEDTFVFPTIYVERVVRINKSDIQTVEGQESIKLDQRIIALFELAEILGIQSDKLKAKRDAFPAVVVSSRGQTLAFAVSEVINEQEVLVKSLGPQLQRVRNFEGATVLEGGKLAPIIHLSDLLEASSRVIGNNKITSQSVQPDKAAQKKILVVEDSITSRTLLKNILEAARYDVQTAVDGMDGLTKVKNDKFDLVVSDVEMPRLHGFDLTARIRADKNLSQLPVVLVTARESQADKEKGIEVGANAYVVKSSFDQNNLLDIIQRII